MSFVLHRNVILRLTAFFITCKEATVSTLQDINFRIMEFRVLMHVQLSIAITKMEGPIISLTNAGGVTILERGGRYIRNGTLPGFCSYVGSRGRMIQESPRC